MKFLLQKENDKLINMISIPDSVTYEVQEVQEAEEKQGFFVIYEYNEKTKKVEAKYVKIPKSEIEILKEKQEQTDKALQDTLMYIAKIRV